MTLVVIVSCQKSNEVNIVINKDPNDSIINPVDKDSIPSAASALIRNDGDLTSSHGNLAVDTLWEYYNNIFPGGLSIDSTLVDFNIESNIISIELRVNSRITALFKNGDGGNTKSNKYFEIFTDSGYVEYYKFYNQAAITAVNFKVKHPDAKFYYADLAYQPFYDKVSARIVFKY